MQTQKCRKLAIISVLNRFNKLKKYSMFSFRLSIMHKRHCSFTADVCLTTSNNVCQHNMCPHLIFKLFYGSLDWSSNCLQHCLGRKSTSAYWMEKAALESNWSFKSLEDTEQSWISMVLMVFDHSPVLLLCATIVHHRCLQRNMSEIALLREIWANPENRVRISNEERLLGCIPDLSTSKMQHLPGDQEFTHH